MTSEEIKKAMRDPKREVVIKNLHKLLSLVEDYPEYEDCISYAIAELEQEPSLDKIRAEISEYGSLWVEYKIEGHNNRDIEKLVENVLKQAKRQVLDVIDKYRK